MLDTPNDKPKVLNESTIAAMAAIGGAERLAKVYRRIRDARAAASKEFKDKDEALKAQLDMIEGHMLLFLQATNQTSAKTDEGTFWREEDIIPAGEDWDLIYRWIAENNYWEALEKRITKTFVKGWQKENGNGVPPGMSILRKYIIKVRKPAGKKGEPDAVDTA